MMSKFMSRPVPDKNIADVSMKVGTLSMSTLSVDL